MAAFGKPKQKPREHNRRIVSKLDNRSIAISAAQFLQEIVRSLVILRIGNELIGDGQRNTTLFVLAIIRECKDIYIFAINH